MARFVLPDFLNLGIAPPAPRGATAVAPRVALVPPFSIHDCFFRKPGARSPQLLPPLYLMPVGFPGLPFEGVIAATPLIPNPYTANG